MVDIHTHILPFLDDGSSGLTASKQMLTEAKECNITHVVFTPHFRENCQPKREEILKSFEKIKPIAEQLGIKVYLGQEIKYNEYAKKKFLSGELLSLNNTKCVLLEFDMDNEEDISDIVYSFSTKGYIPIVAHIERYPYCLDYSIVEEIKNCGGLIQVNAGSITGKLGRKIKKFVLNLIKFNFVDFVASDVHSFRPNQMMLAYNLVKKNFGTQVAEDLFVNHQKKLIIKE